MKDKQLTRGEAAKFLGVHADTLIRWELQKKISPDRHKYNRYRYYWLSDLKQFKEKAVVKN